jgi:hypothetical protein
MKIMLPVLAAVAALALTGCNLKEKYARNNAAATEWLEANAGKSSVKISGAWEASDPGWGAILLEQTGNKVTGSIGSYTVDGHVKGDTAYLALKSDGWVYYTVVAKMSSGKLLGFYSPSVPFSSEDQSAIHLRRFRG